jgi:hypothetical protein
MGFDREVAAERSQRQAAEALAYAPSEILGGGGPLKPPGQAEDDAAPHITRTTHPRIAEYQYTNSSPCPVRPEYSPWSHVARPTDTPITKRSSQLASPRYNRRC